MESALVDQASEQYLGQWKRLVSSTNWEKGRIIHEWRDELRSSGAPSTEYSDDAWSRRVANVTPQHVGRLRRVYDRFAAVRETYVGLFWSHFQAALDWDDAEMWLEGAVQSHWSVEDMRRERYQATGGVGDEPAEQNSSSAEPWDDDGEPIEGTASATMEDVRGPARDDADGELEDQADHDDDLGGYDRSQFDETATADDRSSEVEAARPFADLPPLPADVNDAFEAYKLCILRHKLADWQEISRNDMLASLDSLRQLALAPSDA